ncbi:hypothetical protein AJ79_09335 [Helicocarpus griseus UAMH5409]|uniref:Ell binding protein Ebp1 C-terminal domain-containing protein n=1 Tax=Helicocarpus griseus UAMH5409 TaxID=1447875 RepID=A0A2B7WKS2_9EURO|nr:hypothetical protein AJ79_09335 [Helicocarpus griseus UAMH5409]
MSGELQTSYRTQNTTEPTSRATGKRSYSDYFKDVNTRLKNLTDNILPASPYLLTVPTERPFHLGSRFVSNWAVGDNKPFAPEEEHLQYMTFLSHQGEDTLLVAVGGWSDERGNIMEEDTSKAPSIITSASDAQKNKIQRKKISLSDYKKKANETPKSPSRSATPADQLNGGAHTTSDTKPKWQESSSTTKKPVTLKETDIRATATGNRTESTNGTSGDNNTADPSSRSMLSSCKQPPLSRDSSPPNKKPRVSSANGSPEIHSAKARNAAPVVPALLSPTLPPTSIAPKLPRLLSPTLPPDIEEELAKIKDEQSSSNSHSKSTKTLSSALAGSTSDQPLSRSAQGITNSGSTSSSSDKSAKGRTSSSSAAKLQSSSSTRSVASSSDQTKPSSTSPKFRGTAEAVKAKLIVKLRYGRANRKRIEALLRFSGKYRIPSDIQSSRQKDGLEIDAKRRQPPHSRITEGQRVEKRHKHMEEDGQVPAPKRQKSAVNPTSERPRTPVTNAFKSPSISQQPVTSKAQFLTPNTPNKDLRGATMRRLGSGDADVKTLIGIDRAINSTTTPGGTEKTTTKHSPPISIDNQSSKCRDSTEYRQWRDEFQKYVSLGRELKHASQRYTGPQARDVDDKLGAAIAVEAILCFILAFVFDDKHKTLSRRVGDSSGWRSIVAYWGAVKNITAPYPHLHGLCSILGAVSRDAIHGLDLERLAAITIPSEYSPAPTPGSDGNTVTSEENKKHQKEFSELRFRLVKSYREANQLWLEGSRELSEETLSRQYPVTWSKRSMNFSERGREKLTLGMYSGGYFLPLDRTSIPLEAVRFGWAFLTEWTEKEGVKWKGRLEL